MQFLHGLTMFVCLISCNLWMIFLIYSTKMNTTENFLGFINPSKHEKTLSILILIFIIRVWIMTTLDVINVVNSIFGIFGCEPLCIYERI